MPVSSAKVSECCPRSCAALPYAPAYPFTARKLGLLWHIVRTQPGFRNVWPFFLAPRQGNRVPRLRPHSTARSGLFASGAALGNARVAPSWPHRSADHRPARSAQSYLRSVMAFCYVSRVVASSQRAQREAADRPGYVPETAVGSGRCQLAICLMTCQNLLDACQGRVTPIIVREPNLGRVMG